MVRKRKRNPREQLQIESKTPSFQNADPNPRLIDYIPPDIIEEILLLLPVKALLKFRCVSKSWLSLISSPDFIETHLQKSSKNTSYTHHRLLLTCRDVYNNHNHYFFESFSLNSVLYQYNQVVNSVDIPWDVFNVVGFCNGLVCISSRGGNDLFLWNPSTRKYRKLPDSGEDIKSLHNFCAFGFDESTNDYKMVKLELRQNSSILTVKLYSLKSNSWKRIEDFPARWIDMPSKFVNGKIHWHACHPTRTDIVSLDMQTEIYENIQLPLPFYDITDVDVMLCSLRGCLGMVVTYPCEVSLWILKEYGVQESWTNVINIPHYHPYSKVRSLPLYMSNDGQILLLVGSNLVLYNPKHQSLRYRFVSNNQYYHDADIYVESLVSPYATDGPGAQSQ